MTNVIRSLEDLRFADFIRQKEFGSGLPFIHFTILAGKYDNGIKSTGVEENIKTNGIKENTSAIEIDRNNIEKSLTNAFYNFGHHAVRTNRGLTWTHNDYEKSNSVIPGVVIVDNIGQKIGLKKGIAVDKPGHVWLHATGPETILTIQPLIDNYVNGNDLNFINNQSALSNLIKIYNNTTQGL